MENDAAATHELWKQSEGSQSEMLKTNQGEIQDGKSYKLPPELRKLANERDCAGPIRGAG